MPRDIDSENQIALLMAVGVITHASREGLSNAEMVDRAVAAGAVQVDEVLREKLSQALPRLRATLAHVESILRLTTPAQPEDRTYHPQPTSEFGAI